MNLQLHPPPLTRRGSAIIATNHWLTKSVMKIVPLDLKIVACLLLKNIEQNIKKLVPIRDSIHEYQDPCLTNPPFPPSKRGKS